MQRQFQIQDFKLVLQNLQILVEIEWSIHTNSFFDLTIPSIDLYVKLDWNINELISNEVWNCERNDLVMSGEPLFLVYFVQTDSSSFFLHNLEIAGLLDTRFQLLPIKDIDDLYEFVAYCIKK